MNHIFFNPKFPGALTNQGMPRKRRRKFWDMLAILALNQNRLKNYYTRPTFHE